METKNIVRIAVVVILVLVGLWVFLSDGSSAPGISSSNNTLVVEVPPPTVVDMTEPVNDRVSAINDLIGGALNERLTRQQEIEGLALGARREALKAEEQKARAEREAALAEQEESKLRARRAANAPLVEPREEHSYPPPSFMGHQPPVQEPVVVAEPPKVEETKRSSRPKGLNGASLTMLSGDTAVIAIDGNTVRLTKGRSQQGYSLVSIDHGAKSVVLRDTARGSQKTVYLNHSGGRVMPTVRSEKESVQELPMGYLGPEPGVDY